MAYKLNRNRRKSSKDIDPAVEGSLSTAMYAQGNPDQRTDHFYELETAEVMDVIYNSDHPQFRTWEDIGKAQIRFIHSDFNKTEEKLPWAKPADPNKRGFPLKHELVVVGEFANQYYYTERLSQLAHPNHNEASWISIDLQYFKNKSKGDSYSQAQMGHTEGNYEDDPDLGEYFNRIDEIHPLEHDEGDIILEGRWAHSIAFRRNVKTDKPVIWIRCGQYEEAYDKDYLEIIRENIDDDPSSIYLCEDHPVDLTPATIDNPIHFISADNAVNPIYKGKEILSNTDRQVHNSRAKEYIVFAEGAINMMTKDIFTYDAAKDVRSRTFEDNVTVADKSILEEAGCDVISEAGNNYLVRAGGQTRFMAPTHVFIGNVHILGNLHVLGASHVNVRFGPNPIPGVPIVPNPPTKCF